LEIVTLFKMLVNKRKLESTTI